MKKISTGALNDFVNANIDNFHAAKINTLQNLSLKKVLRQKNPYLFKAKNINSASDLIQEVMSAYLSSSEEKLFGDFLEELAIFISSKTCGGHKSSATGIDLEFENKGVYHLVSIKSGTQWGNSSQQKKQESDLIKAVAVIKQSKQTSNVEPVLGICYGKTKTSYVRGYKKVVGQSFWYLISENRHLYLDIIEPLGYRAREHNDKFLLEKERINNLFTKEFIENFCDKNGSVNWNRIVEFNSGNLS